LGRFLLFVREITVFAEDTPCQDARLSADAEKKNPIGKSGGGLLPKSSNSFEIIPGPVKIVPVSFPVNIQQVSLFIVSLGFARK